MTDSNSSRLSELDIADVLRRRAVEMHQAVDNWFELTVCELGVQLVQQPKHSIGISFEPGVVLEYVPPDTAQASLGIYAVRPERKVEVVPSGVAGKVFFEIIDNHGQLSTTSMDQALFALLFRKTTSETKTATPTGKAVSQVSYGLHPVDRSIAVRYNIDGTVTLGRYDDRGDFIECV